MNDEEEETNPSPNESDDSIQSPAFGKDFESFDQCTPPRNIIEEDVENASQIDPAELDIEAKGCDQYLGAINPHASLFFCF